MSVKDPFEILADELTLIRKDMDKLQRTSLDKDEAKTLHKVVANGVKQMNESGATVQEAIDRRLVAVAAVVRDSASEAAESAVRDLLSKNHAETLKAAQSLSQAAGEARRQAWRYFGGFWVWLTSMLATGIILGLLLAYGTETAKSFFSVEDMVWYSCGKSWFAGRSSNRTMEAHSAHSGSKRQNRPPQDSEPRQVSQASSRRTSCAMCGSPERWRRSPDRLSWRAHKRRCRADPSRASHRFP